MTKVSLCMIVKDEEKNLVTCLESVGKLVQEIVVVDTGSTDKTKKVAKEFGAKIFDCKWTDSFADARNFALSQTTLPWILSLDADDVLSALARYRLHDLFTNLEESKGYLLHVNSVLSSTSNSIVQVKLFAYHPDLKWKYRCHEQISPSIRSLGWNIEQVPIAIEHRGYYDLALQQKKLERNLHLLELDYLEHPTDYFVLFNLGILYKRLNKLKEGHALLRKAARMYQYSVCEDEVCSV